MQNLMKLLQGANFTANVFEKFTAKYLIEMNADQASMAKM